ncbi:MAG: hypothetical protein LBI27_03890, partial [Clostridiales bacterium]|nr:hypothetical protein [Clostridiales bacterium]
MKKFLVLTFAILVLHTVPIFAEEDYAAGFLANHIATIYSSTFNNFPSDGANAVLQTRDGFMWFGGYNGLYRYDVSRFTAWDSVSPNGFRSSSIRSLYECSDGVLWIGSNDRGLVALENGNFYAYDISAGLPSNMIRAITSDSDGAVFCGTPEGIFRIDHSENTVSEILLDTEIKQFAISLCVDENDNLFAVLSSGELFAYTQSGETIMFEYDEPFYDVEIVSGNRVIAGLRNGDIIITTLGANGFEQIDTISTSLTNIAAVFEGSNGFIWIAADNGIGFLDADYNFHDGGNPNGVGFYNGIFEDYQNNLWISAERGGNVRLTASAFTDWNKMVQFETGTANAIVVHDGYTYIGTNNGLFILDEYNELAHTDFTDLLTERIRGLQLDRNGNIWISTYSDYGVIRYTPRTNSFRNWAVNEGMQTERTRLVHELPTGAFAVALASGVDFILGDDVVSVNTALGFSEEIQIELPEIMVLSIVYTDGALYLGTDGSGVYRINENGTTRFREENGLSGGVVLRMLADDNGVWVAASPGLSFVSNDGD